MTIPRKAKATGPRILVKVKPTEMQEKTKSDLLYIPEEVVNQEARAAVEGTVMDMGAQCYNLPSQSLPDGTKAPWCKVGDTVVFAQYAGSRILIDGFEGFVLLNDEDILMVLDGGGE